MNGMITLNGEATRYMKKTSDSGNTNSMFGYVFLLKTGSGVLTNKKEAAKLFKKLVMQDVLMDIKNMMNYVMDLASVSRIF